MIFLSDTMIDFSKEKNELKSDFNEGKLQIYRLNNSWERFQDRIRKGLLEAANWELDDIFGELSTDAENKDKDLQEKEKYSYKIKKLSGLLINNKNNGDSTYKILRLKEKVLRRLQDTAGKGSKRSSSDEDDIDT